MTGNAVPALIWIGVGLLLFQASWLFFASIRKAHQTWTALLTATIAGLIALNFYLWSQHLLVSDLQDRVLLTQGSARWLLQLLVFT